MKGEEGKAKFCLKGFSRQKRAISTAARSHRFLPSHSFFSGRSQHFDQGAQAENNRKRVCAAQRRGDPILDHTPHQSVVVVRNSPLILELQCFSTHAIIILLTPPKSRAIYIPCLQYKVIFPDHHLGTNGQVHKVNPVFPFARAGPGIKTLSAGSLH
jgi:hypothetical protein